jgi:hypothetical protein
MRFECLNCFSSFDTEEDDDYEFLEEDESALLNLPCPNCGNWNSMVGVSEDQLMNSVKTFFEDIKKAREEAEARNKNSK